jgi:hypothetical protein
MPCLAAGKPNICMGTPEHAHIMLPCGTSWRKHHQASWPPSAVPQATKCQCSSSSKSSGGRSKGAAAKSTADSRASGSHALLVHILVPCAACTAREAPGGCI